jgi:hypothetical protein
VKHICVPQLLVSVSLLALAGCAGRADRPQDRSEAGEFLDRTKDGASPQLVARAEKALRGNIVRIWERNNAWSSRRIFTVYTSQGDQGVFVEKEGNYIQINSGLKIELVNEIL